MKIALEEFTPRTGHINILPELLEQTGIAQIRRIESMQNEPLHLNALHQLQFDGWLWKREPFRECIRAHFDCEPEELKYRDYSRARMILSDISIFNQFHYEPYNPQTYEND